MSKSSALLTDHYELTMVDAALKAGTANRDSVFELFARRIAGERRYGVVAGTGRFLEQLQSFRFTDKELQWLKDKNFLRSETIDWLANYRFRGNIYGYPEGEIFFPGSPVLTVESSFAEGVLLETLALSIFNYDCAVATAASRMFSAAKGKPLAEMGSRRTSEYSAVSAARAAYIAGFNATSNLEAGRTYSLPTMGTAAHAFTLLHDDERAAFTAQIAAFGADTTLLVDTYDIEEGVKNAIEIAGTKLGAVRIDSGDLPVVVAQVRKQLDSLGATETKITVTNDLDEHTIAALAASPVDNFGVGTSVVTGSGTPAMGMVYKLVARADATGKLQPVAKRSSGKTSIAGKKTAWRAYGKKYAEAEILNLDSAQTTQTKETTRKLQKITTELVNTGAVNPTAIGVNGIAAARARHAESLKSLPPIAFSLRRGDPCLATEVVTSV